MIQPNGLIDDLSRKAEAAVGVGCRARCPKPCHRSQIRANLTVPSGVRCILLRQATQDAEIFQDVQTRNTEPWDSRYFPSYAV